MQRFHRFLTAACIMVGAASPVGAQTSLQYGATYEPGQVIKMEVSTSVDQTLTVAGMPFDTDVETFLLSEETVTEANAQQAVIEGHYTKVHVDMKTAGLSFTFNSGKNDTNANAGQLEPLRALFQAMSETSWKTTTTSDGEITDVTIDEQPFADVPDDVRQQFTPEAIKDGAKKQLAKLPTEPVKVGDTWDRYEEMNFGGGQTFQINRTYKYEGQENHRGRMQEKITVVTNDVKYVIDATKSSNGLKVNKSDLKIEDAAGTLWFDPAKKDISEVDDELHVVGELVLEVLGQEAPSELDLKTHSNSLVK